MIVDQNEKAYFTHCMVKHNRASYVFDIKELNLYFIQNYICYNFVKSTNSVIECEYNKYSDNLLNYNFGNYDPGIVGVLYNLPINIIISESYRMCYEVIKPYADLVGLPLR